MIYIRELPQVPDCLQLLANNWHLRLKHVSTLLGDLVVTSAHESFRWVRVGTTFRPIIKVLKNALWTALRTIFRQKKTSNRLLDFACTISKTFRGWYPRSLAVGRGRPHAPTPSNAQGLDSEKKFNWARQGSHCSCFTKRPLLWHGRLVNRRVSSTCSTSYRVAQKLTTFSYASPLSNIDQFSNLFHCVRIRRKFV